jgi:hypothetical protein
MCEQKGSSQAEIGMLETRKNLVNLKDRNLKSAQQQKTN